MINPLDYPIVFMTPKRFTRFSAWHEHIPFAFFIVDLLRPHIIVELGTHYGDSYCAFCQAVKELSLQTMCYAVDTWQGDPHAGFYGPEVLSDLRAHHDPLYADFSKLVQSTFDEALQLFPDRSIDLLHIDGFHTYDAVKHDFFSWLPKMSSRGVVLLHDTNISKPGFGVKTFLNEVRNQYPCFEFYHGCGLGILAVGEHVPEALKEILNASPEEADIFRRHFAQLGRGLILRLERKKIQGSTEVGRATKQLASIVIPVYNNWEYTRRCLLSLEAAGYRDRAEVIVVDNASSDATPSGLKTVFPWVKSLRNEQNRGFAVACNRGAEAAEGKYLVFLNNDTEVRKGWLENLIAAYEAEKGAGVVGSKLLYPDGSLQHAGVEIIYPGRFFPIDARHIRYRQPDNPDTRREVDAVTGASMLVPADVFYELGGFEEIYKNGFEDVDFCLKARARGHRIIYEPSSQAVHYESKTPGRFDSELKNINILHRRWLPWVLEHYRKASPPEELQPLNRPPVSIIIVTYNSLSTIAACLESVLATTTSADEIIVVDNNSRDETSYYVECLNNALVGRQIRLCQETQNTGYAGAAAKGARLAKHDFLVFLNPDTTVFSGWIEGLLTPLLGDNPKMAASGPVSNYAAGLQNITKYIGGRDDLEKDPVYLAKTACERCNGKVVPTNLLIGFCLAVRKQAYEEIGGIDDSLFLGNDDLDLSWRLGRAGYQQVVVPSVFVFHRGQESFATEPKVKTKYLVQQSTNQLYEKLYASYNGHVPDGKSLWGIEWFSPQKDLISVIMPVYKGASLTRLALTTLVQATKRPFEVIIINNGSDPEATRALARMAKELPATIRVLSNEQNLGYPRAVNQGLAEANGDYLVVMNNDVLVTPFWASRLIAAFAVDPALGIVGPRTNYAAGIQAVTGCNYTEESLAEWAQKWYLGEAGTLRAVNRLIGFLWMMKREVVERIGGFDPLFGIGNYEDDDYCIRAQLAGFKLALADDVFVHHYGSQSFKKKPDSYQMLLDVNRMLFAGKWDVDFFNNGYQMEPILARGCASFDQGDLYIPLGFDDVFSPSLEPLDIGCSLANCLMCVPDPSDIHQTWLDLVKRYLQTYKPGSGVALMIRVEPSTKEWFLRVVSSIEEMARKEGLDLERDDLIIESRRVPSSHRGSVYRAASFFIPLPGVRREPLIREARSCGLTIVEPEKLGANALGPGIGKVMVR